MKTLSDVTLKSMTKSELIEHLRCAEHNYAVAKETIEQQAKNFKNYEPCEQMYMENRRVKAYVSIMDGMEELEKISPTKFIGALEEMEETEKLVKVLLSRYEKGGECE